MAKIAQFFREVKTELFKVIWPSRQDTVRMTITVILFSIGVAVLLGVIDLGLSRFIQWTLIR